MCGIGGKLSFATRPDGGVAEAMAARMGHRGPDADGVFVDGPIALAHTRLSIIDLSEAGRQPMANADGSVRIVFNGEIYNYRELRERVEHYPFRSETDTEVLLHLYEEEGVDCLRHLRGMFAFAIWDANRGRLFLARDRLGQKPLFYRSDGDTFWFGSTIRTLLADDEVPARPDLPALREYLTYQYVPAPRTGFEGIRQLRPAEYLLVDEDGVRGDRYWDLSFADQSGASPSVLAERLRERFAEATRLRMRSDVPVGAFLSGGVDSSAVVATMAEFTDQPVRTYAIGFDEYDELEYAEMVADRFDTDHTVHRVTPDALETLPELIEHYEMPFGDPSALPTYYVSKVASNDVTVALAGDAGDENFAGYDRYRYDRWTTLAASVPRPALAVGGRAFEAVPGTLPGGTVARRVGSLLENARGDEVERYAPYVCHMLGADARAIWNGPEPADELGTLREAFADADGPTRLDRLLDVDIHTYLPDDLLVKADRASMAHSIELRSPFLDHEFVTFAAGVPAKYKHRRGEGKWLLKRAFRDVLPDPVLDREKQGFSVPVDEWFRGELRAFAREKLDRLGDRNPFDAAGIDARLDDHLDGTDHGFHLWDLVVLEGWYERFID